MTFDERINNVLEDEASNKYIVEQLPIIRENIIECERRFSKTFIGILSLIGITEFIRLGKIKSFSFFSAEIVDLSFLTIILPCIIGYYSYAIICQLVLRSTLSKLFFKIIKSKHPKISENHLDDFLITHLNSSIESILVQKPRNLTKRLIDIFSAPSLLFIQWGPIIYSIFLLCKLSNIYPSYLFWIAVVIISSFYIRAILLIIAYYKDSGGYMNFVKELIPNKYFNN